MNDDDVKRAAEHLNALKVPRRAASRDARNLAEQLDALACVGIGGVSLPGVASTLRTCAHLLDQRVYSTLHQLRTQLDEFIDVLSHCEQQLERVAAGSPQPNQIGIAFDYMQVKRLLLALRSAKGPQ